MPNCRSVPPEAWGHAREALIRYFASRHGRTDAEDMAQETLSKVWEREDYQFDKVSDFPKVCLGFARLISQEGFRTAKSAHTALEFDAPAPAHTADSHRATESRILFQEVCKAGATGLKEGQWRVIREAILEKKAPRQPLDESSREANRERVYLHRARQKLRELTRWRKNEM